MGYYTTTEAPKKVHRENTDCLLKSVSRKSRSITLESRLGNRNVPTKVASGILFCKRLDPITGTYVYHYRHYHPQLGRWLSRDPIQEKGGVNLYGFVGNNSINKWDVFGYFSGPWWNPNGEPHSGYPDNDKPQPWSGGGGVALGSGEEGGGFHISIITHTKITYTYDENGCPCRCSQTNRYLVVDVYDWVAGFISGASINAEFTGEPVEGTTPVYGVSAGVGAASGGIDVTENGAGANGGVGIGPKVGFIIYSGERTITLIDEGEVVCVCEE